MEHISEACFPAKHWLVLNNKVILKIHYQTSWETRYSVAALSPVLSVIMLHELSIGIQIIVPIKEINKLKSDNLLLNKSRFIMQICQLNTKFCLFIHEMQKWLLKCNQKRSICFLVQNNLTRTFSKMHFTDSYNYFY